MARKKTASDSGQLVLGSQDSAGMALEARLKSAANVPTAGVALTSVMQQRREGVMTVLAKATDGEMTALASKCWSSLPMWMRQLVRDEAKGRGLAPAEDD